MQQQRVDAVATEAELVVTVDGLGPLACILSVAKLVKTDELRSPVLSPAPFTLRASPGSPPNSPCHPVIGRRPGIPPCPAEVHGANLHGAVRVGAQNVDNGGYPPP